MLYNKPIISVVISILVVALAYSSISAFNVFAVPNEAPPNADCEVEGTFTPTTWCCWTETDPGDPEGIELYYCQTCRVDGDCNEKRPNPQPGPTPPPSGPVAPLQGGVLEQPPTPPSFDPTAPLQSGVLEQQEPPTPLTFAPGASPGVLEQLPSEGGVTQRGCQSNVITTCLPCDLGLPGASCIPASEWPPDTAQLEQGEGATPWFVPGFLERQQLQPPPAEQGAAELPPPTTEETQPATAEEEQPVPVCQEGLEFNEDLGFCVPTECPEGQELNDETGLCVLEEQEVAEEEPEQSESQEPDEAQPEEEQPSEEDSSEDNNNDN